MTYNSWLYFVELIEKEFAKVILVKETRKCQNIVTRALAEHKVNQTFVIEYLCNIMLLLLQ